jgi:hypothetical protein
VLLVGLTMKFLPRGLSGRSSAWDFGPTGKQCRPLAFQARRGDDR